MPSFPRWGTPKLKLKHYYHTHNMVIPQWIKYLNNDLILAWKVSWTQTINNTDDYTYENYSEMSWHLGRTSHLSNFKGTVTHTYCWHRDNNQTRMTAIKQEEEVKKTGTYHLAAWDWHRKNLGGRGQWWSAWCGLCVPSELTGGQLAAYWMWMMHPTPLPLCWCHLENTGYHVCKVPSATCLCWELAQSRKETWLNLLETVQ